MNKLKQKIWAKLCKEVSKNGVFHMENTAIERANVSDIHITIDDMDIDDDVVTYHGTCTLSEVCPGGFTQKTYHFVGKALFSNTLNLEPIEIKNLV